MISRMSDSAGTDEKEKKIYMRTLGRFKIFLEKSDLRRRGVPVRSTWVTRSWIGKAKEWRA